MERRSFLKWAAAGSALTGWNYGPAAAQPSPNRSVEAEDPEFPADDYRAPDWLRYSRTVYFDGYTPPAYPPMKDFDAKRIVEIVVKLGGNMLRFQPVGHAVLYPSEVYPEAPELGNRDLIAEVARQCRRVGIYLYCYIMWGTAVFMNKPIDWVEKHPSYADWLLRGPDGRPYGVTRSGMGWPTSSPKIHLTGDAYREALRQFVREYCEHDIDGVYFDQPSSFTSSGVCFCDSCRGSFKKFSGIDLERLANVRDLNQLPSDVDMQALVAWYEWAQQLIKEDLIDLRKIIHGSGKFMLLHEGADGWRGTALRKQYLFGDGVMQEARPEIYLRLTNGMLHASIARPHKMLAQVYFGTYATSYFGQPPHNHPWAPHEANLEDEDEVRMAGFADLACGAAPMYLSANRLYYGIGSASAEPAKEVFEVMRRVEGIHKDSVPVPYVAIVPTWESLQRWRTQGSSWNMMMSGSLALAILDAGISIDVYPSTEMSREWLGEQRVIAMCGASGISDKEARKLGEWVKGGGGLLATYDTGLYNEVGQLRQDGGALKEVLGVEMKGESLVSQPECYYRVQQSHAALGEYGKGAVVQGDGQLVLVEAREGATVLADCWNLGTNESLGPAIVVHSYGKGRTIYVSGSLEAHYSASRVVSNRRVLASMVRYLGGGEPLPFTLTAPRGVYAVLRRATNGDLVLWVLANVGFKDANVGYMRQEYVPVSNVGVGIRVPEGRQVKAVELVRARQSVPFKIEKGYTVATISTLHIAEIVHFKLG